MVYVQNPKAAIPIYLKTAKFLYLMVFIACASCRAEHVEETMKSRLMGIWIEVEPCKGCSELHFGDNSIAQKHKFNPEELLASYKIVGKDSIEVTRLWDIEANKKVTRHQIRFLSSDSIVIKAFSPVDYGITGFEDIKMIRVK